jgi:hypothetical protein
VLKKPDLAGNGEVITLPLSGPPAISKVLYDVLLSIFASIIEVRTYSLATIMNGLLDQSCTGNVRACMRMLFTTVGASFWKRNS